MRRQNKKENKQTEMLWAEKNKKNNIFRILRLDHIGKAWRSGTESCIKKAERNFTYKNRIAKLIVFCISYVFFLIFCLYFYYISYFFHLQVRLWLLRFKNFSLHYSCVLSLVRCWSERKFSIQYFVNDILNGKFRFAFRFSLRSSSEKL